MQEPDDSLADLKNWQATRQPRAYTGVLFLPAIQLPATREQIRHVYRDAIKQSLSGLKPDRWLVTEPLLISRLDIAVLLDGGLNTSRSQLFHAFQTFIAELYTLVCIEAGRLDVELDFPGGVDVRLYALDAPYADDQNVDQTLPYASVCGPIATLSSFRASRKHWERVLVTGQQSLHDSFLQRNWAGYLNSCINADPRSAWISIQQVSAPPWEDNNALHHTITEAALDHKKTLHHSRVAVGGTFDHLHMGHKLLLTATVFIAQPGPEPREITIGITGDELLVKKKHASVLESWERRQEKIADFVESILVFHPDISSVRSVEKIDEPGPNGKVVRVTYDLGSTASGKITIHYVRISDPFGPTITDESITALIISAETRAGGKAVNDKRVEKGWAPLEVFEVDVLDAPSAADSPGQHPDNIAAAFESKISSTEIRRRLEAGEGEPMVEGPDGKHQPRGQFKS